MSCSKAANKRAGMESTQTDTSTGESDEKDKAALSPQQVSKGATRTVVAHNPSLSTSSVLVLGWASVILLGSACIYVTRLGPEATQMPRDKTMRKIRQL